MPSKIPAKKPAAKSSTGKKSSRDKVRVHRERMRRKGLRLVQFWLPDVDSPAFKAEAHRQSLAVSRSPHAREDQAFIDSLTDWSDD